jgi:5-formyltetrahydrofolate cyclo-ligase
MTKAELRNIYLQKRKTISAADSIIYLLKIFANLNSFNLKNIHTLLTYNHIENKNEIAVSHINRALQQLHPHITFAYPVSNTATNTMQAMAVNKHTHWAINKYLISEPTNGQIINPADINMAIIPLLSFDQKGYRVGYGKGYYDKYLAKCSNCIKVGLSFFEPEEFIADTNQYDVPLNYCITPQKIYEF